MAYRRRLCGAALALAAALALNVGSAQTPDTSISSADETIEEIVVTGTRIKRRDFVTPSPLTTIDSEDIMSSGQPTLEQAMNYMPQVMPSYSRVSNNPGTGDAQMDLRGLGPGRSLVLLNGRRVAPAWQGSAVDLNNIPQFLVERVEIITGGASAVYGSDAIAGVANFITRQDYDGFVVQAGMSTTEEGDGETYDFNVAWGYNFENGRGNLTLFANRMERKELLAGDREFTSIDWGDDWEGELYQRGSQFVPDGIIIWPRVDFGSGPARVTFEPDGTPREFIYANDNYNFAPVNYLQIPLERTAVGLMGHYDISGTVEAYVETSFARNEPAINLAPVPWWSPAQVNLDNPELSAELQQFLTDNYACDVNLACLTMGRRMAEVGSRYREDERDYQRTVLGLRGDLGENWSFDGWITYTTSPGDDYQVNAVSTLRILQGLLVDPATGECYDPSDGCVPVNLFGAGAMSAEAADFVRSPNFRNELERTNKLASLFVTGSPFNTWAGPLELAIGAEWREDEIELYPDERAVNSDSVGFGLAVPIDGSTSITEFYGEAVIPLASGLKGAEHLAVELGARFTDYEFADDGWTYKAGLEWEPIEALRLRAMFQRSVRAANVIEMFEQQDVAPDFLRRIDPCSASADPVGSGISDKCLIQGLPADQLGVFEGAPFYPINMHIGGNPYLEPEEGDTLTVGAIISPLRFDGFTMSVDYYEMEITETIGGISSFDICFDPINADHVFCDNLRRDATGNISDIFNYTSNLGLLKTRGIDTQVSYQTELFAGTIDVNLYWTHLLSSKFQENPVTTVYECTGYFGWPCLDSDWQSVVAENRTVTNIQYARGPLGVHLSWRWIEGTENAASLGSHLWGIEDPDLAVPSIDDEHYVDLGFTWEFAEWLNVRFGIVNLLDNDPPQMADSVWSNNTDTGMFDVFGRGYYLTLRSEF